MKELKTIKNELVRKQLVEVSEKLLDVLNNISKISRYRVLELISDTDVYKLQNIPGHIDIDIYTRTKGKLDIEIIYLNTQENNEKIIPFKELSKNMYDNDYISINESIVKFKNQINQLLGKPNESDIISEMKKQSLIDTQYCLKELNIINKTYSNLTLPVDSIKSKNFKIKYKRIDGKIIEDDAYVNLSQTGVFELYSVGLYTKDSYFTEYGGIEELMVIHKPSYVNAITDFKEKVLKSISNYTK